MDKNLKTKLLAFFAINAPPVPEEIKYYSEEGKIWNSTSMMQVEQWRSQYALKQMNAFEEMLKTIDSK